MITGTTSKTITIQFGNKSKTYKLDKDINAASLIYNKKNTRSQILLNATEAKQTYRATDMSQFDELIVFLDKLQNQDKRDGISKNDLTVLYNSLEKKGVTSPNDPTTKFKSVGIGELYTPGIYEGSEYISQKTKAGNEMIFEF